MNFLAHAVLAGDRDADRIGGLIGDFVKGPLPAGLPPALASDWCAHLPADEVQRLNDAIGRFDFSAAQAAIDALREDLASSAAATP